jgi:hypothetical protein
VQQMAVRLVVDEGSPYRAASWHLWRDRRVVVPDTTVPNGVEAGGKEVWRRGRSIIGTPLWPTSAVTLLC